MRRPTVRLGTAFALVWVALLVVAPLALAVDTTYGEGTYGPADDQVVTNAGFIIIAFFPAFVFVMSVLQWRLDKRKEARKAAAKRRRANAQWQGGW
jgi:hypothetical protein